MPDETKCIPVHRCLSCDTNHVAVLFKPINGYRYRIEDRNMSGAWNYWGICPVTGDPIGMDSTFICAICGQELSIDEKDQARTGSMCYECSIALETASEDGNV